MEKLNKKQFLKLSDKDQDELINMHVGTAKLMGKNMLKHIGYLIIIIVVFFVILPLIYYAGYVLFSTLF